MRLREPARAQRTLCIATILLLLAPLASAALSPVSRERSEAPPPVLHASDVLAGLTADSARASGEVPWQEENGTFLLHGDEPGRGVLSIVVEGMDVLAFRYDAPLDGALALLVDGGPPTPLPAGQDAAFDLALDGGRHVVSWVGDVQAGVALALRVLGVDPLLPPRVLYVPSVVHECRGWQPTLSLRLVWARLLPSGLLAARVDGEPVDVRVWEGWGSRALTTVDSYAYVPLPHGLDQATVELDATLPDGRVVELLRQAVRIERHSFTSAWGPQGWVYDLRPSIQASSSCQDDPLVDARLTLDGEDATARLDRWETGARFTFDHDVKFGEEHAYALEATFEHAGTIRTEGTFIEGLDVLEMDVHEGALRLVEDHGAAWMSARENRRELPPVRLRAGAGDFFPDGLTEVPFPEGARLRAVYAPRAISCDGRGMCQPYGGDAPEFGWWNTWSTPLTIVSPQGEWTASWTLGQLVAASHRSDPDAWLMEWVDAVADDAQGSARGLL